MKKRYVLAALAVMTVLAGCGDNASQQKNTDNTTQESTAEDDLTAADPDEDGEELDPEFSDRKSTRLNSSHDRQSRMPSSA